MPETGLSPLRLTVWALFALGGLLWIALLVRLIQMIWQHFQPLNVWARYAEESSPYRRRRRPAWGCLGFIFLLLAGALLIGSGAGLWMLDDATRQYTPLPAENAAVAQVQCGPAGAPLSCQLALLTASPPYTVTVQGTNWEVVGEVVVWDPVLEGFGLRSGYRLLRLVSRDAQGHIVQDIALPGASTGLGELVPYLDGRFPFVRARREAAPGAAAGQTQYDLRVSRAGFSLHKMEWSQP